MKRWKKHKIRNTAGWIGIVDTHHEDASHITAWVRPEDVTIVLAALNFSHSNEKTPSDATDCSPVAWLHVLDTTEGIPENEPWKILSFDEDHPFGEPGRDYSAEYGPPVSSPLYFRENAGCIAQDSESLANG